MDLSRARLFEASSSSSGVTSAMPESEAKASCHSTGRSASRTRGHESCRLLRLGWQTLWRFILMTL
jgi:hypothetical protein